MSVISQEGTLTAAWSSANPSLHWPWSLCSFILCRTNAVHSCADSKANPPLRWGDPAQQISQVVRLAVERMEAAGSASYCFKSCGWTYYALDLIQVGPSAPRSGAAAAEAA